MKSAKKKTENRQEKFKKQKFKKQRTILDAVLF